MVFAIAGGTQSTGDLISNSLRFNDDDSAYLNRTPSTATNNDKLTFSFWAKRSTQSANHKILTRYSSADNRFYIGFASNDKIYIYQKVGGTESFNLQTNRLFRDPAAWYHIVVAFDTTQGTAANRIKLYVNGTQETSFSTSNYPDQNLDLYYQSATSVVAKIGQYDSSQYYDGYFAYIHLVDGQQLAPTSFGETDSNGFWIPIEYEGTYGDEGFRLEFKGTGTSANASGKGADTSGNGNHWDDNGMTAEDITTDTPMNNFSNGNPLILIAGGNITPSFSEGNIKWTAGANGSYGSSGHGNMAVTNGKWYWEMKIDSGRSNGVNCGISPVSVFESKYGTSTSTDYTYAQDNYGSFGYQFTNSGSKKITGTAGGNATDYGSPNWSVDDIIGVAMDLDNDTLTFYLNGTSQGEAFSSLPDVYYTPAWYGYSSTVWEFNSGNPYNTISSGNRDGNGHGDFEYAVPAGFYSLNTKNLAEFG